MNKSLTTLGCLILALPLSAQVNSATPNGQSGATRNYDSSYNTTTTTDTSARRYQAGADVGDFSADASDWEFTLGGSGVSNQDLDSSSGGVSASVGYYLSDTLEVVVRQTANYANPEGGESTWLGSTRVALDQHIGSARLRPYVGVNFGAIYGEDVEETLAAGIEGGLKFYVLAQTFLYAHVEYDWAFDDADDAEDNFDTGGFVWSVGVGFNF